MTLSWFAVTVVFIICHGSTTLHGPPGSEATLLVVPTWDQAPDNDTETTCLLEEENSSHGLMFSLHGNTESTCSLLVNVSLESNVRLETPDWHISEVFTLYVERLDALNTYCPHKYVLFDEHATGCGSIFHHDTLQVNVQGNVNIVLGEVLVPDTIECPESVDEDELSSSNVNLTTMCSGTKVYDNLITCELDDEYRCTVDFQVQCDVILRHREVVFECVDDGVLETQQRLLIYPSGTLILDLSYNAIVQVEPDSFQGFNELQQLFLNYNPFTSLSPDVFNQLNNF